MPSVSRARARASRMLTVSCASTVSTICVPMLSTGFSVIIGSWKIIAMRRPRISRISGGEPDEILAPEQDASADHPSGRIEEPQDRESGDRLARAGLPDEPQHFATTDLEAYAVHGLDDALLGEEMRLEILDPEDGS